MVGAVFLVGVSVHGCVLHLAPLLGDQAYRHSKSRWPSLFWEAP